MARCLYDHFVTFAQVHGCTELKAVTTPGNNASLEFHRAWGMELTGTPNRDGIPVIENYRYGTGSSGIAKEIESTESNQPLTREIKVWTWFEGIAVRRNFENGWLRNRDIPIELLAVIWIHNCLARNELALWVHNLAFAGQRIHRGTKLVALATFF